MGRGPTPDPISLVYKTVATPNSGLPDAVQSDVSLYVDVYPPCSHLNDTPTPEDSCVGMPAVVYFHGGGLVVGNRKSWFPEWLRCERFTTWSIYPCSGRADHKCRAGRLSEQGVALLSADYRLLSPLGGHEIVEDIQDLFAYILGDLNPALARAAGGLSKLKINIGAIGVAGSSAGGLCTYLCAMHLSPKPRALLSVYGQAGECLVRRF